MADPLLTDVPRQWKANKSSWKPLGYIVGFTLSGIASMFVVGGFGGLSIVLLLVGIGIFVITLLVRVEYNYYWNRELSYNDGTIKYIGKTVEGFLKRSTYEYEGGYKPKGLIVTYPCYYFTVKTDPPLNVAVNIDSEDESIVFHTDVTISSITHKNYDDARILANTFNIIIEDSYKHHEGVLSNILDKIFG